MTKSKTFPGRLSFFINGFPPVKIKVPASATYTPKQPLNKESSIKGMQHLKKQLKQLSLQIDNLETTGKTKHPAFGYLNAKEWFQLIEMHFRHHKRQKRRIEQFLKL